MKNLNLIKRLWKTDSHEKQSPQRFARYAAMLIMLLTLGVGQMWAYTIIRSASLAGATGDWSNSDVMTQVGSSNVYYKTYTPTAATDLFFRIGTGSGWNTQKNSDGIDNLNSNVVMVSDGSGDKNIKFQIPTSVAVTIYYNNSTNKIWIKVASYKTDVLDGKEMFYYGFTNNWSETMAYFYDNSTKKFGSYAANSYADNSAKLAIGVYDVNSSTKYSASNSSSWKGIEHTGMAGGDQIQTYNDGSNKCYHNAADQFSFGTTAYTIVVGQTIASFPTISFTSKQSGADANLSLEGYYYSTATSGETWNTFTPGTTESSLAAGTYYIKALATDGAIYMASTNYITLTVNSAPVLGVANATSVTNNSATFNATATLNSNTTSSYGFKYGAGASYDTKAELISGGTTASTTGALAGTTFSKEVTGLSASTTYYYISYAVVNGTTYYSDAVKSFTTPAAATYNLSVVAGTGISAVTGSTNNISASQNIAITATVATGYTWNTWTKTGTGTLSTFTAGTKNQTVTVGTVGNMTLTASATENMTTVTVNVSPAGAGTLTLDASAFTPGNTTTAGVATSHTVVASANSGYTFLGWYRDGNAAGTNSTNTYTLKGNGSSGTGTLIAVFAANASSNWYLIGGPFGNNWNTSNHNYPLNLKYRGMSNVYMRVVAFGGGSNSYYKPMNNNSPYGQSSGSDVSVVTGTQYTISATSAENTAFKTNGQGTVWCIVDATNSTKKFWVQEPVNYFPVTLSNGSGGNVLSSTEGTISLKTKNYGELATIYYALNESIKVAITAKSGYWIDDISINGSSVATDVNASSWNGWVTMPSTNATLTVTYNRIYSLSYNANGGSGAAPATTYHISGTNATAAAASTFTARAYYTFGGWNTAQYITGTNYAAGASVPMTANTTLYAKWTRSVTLNQEDATTTGSTSVTGTYNCATLPAITNPKKTGYEFGGWYTETAGNGNLVINTSGQLQTSKFHWTDASGRFDRTTEKAAADLYAKWTQTVTLNANTDNHGSGSNKTATVIYKKEALSSITHCTPATGYHLVGYYTAATDGVKVLNADGSFASSAVTDYITDGKWTKAGATTLYAHYEANTYTIAFDPNDANYVGEATGTTASIDATYDESYTLTSNGFERAGYTFAGWATSATGAVTYTDGQTVSNLTSTNGGTKTLYAKWTPKTYTVTFNARGGSGLTPTSKDVTMGSAYGELATVTPPAGYIFDGWYTSAGGGTKVTSATQVTTAVDHTLYAHYIQKAQVYFKNTFGWSKVWVTYDANWDGTQGTGNQGKTYHQMKLVSGTTDIYYDDIPDDYITSWRWNIAFNNLDYSSTPFYAFDNGEAVYRMDFDKKSTMFVPTSATGATDDGNFKKNNDKVQYRSTGYTGDGGNPKYTSGYWRTYNNTYSGYTMTYQKKNGSWSNGHKMESSSVSDNIFVYTVHMDANSQYNFAFYKERDVNTKSVQFCYDNTTQINSGNCTNLKLDCNPNNSYMQTTVEGDYTFKLEMKNDGHMYLTVEYPLAVGDFRVRYNYTKGSAKTYYSEYIKAKANGKDTISIFIHSGDSASSRSITLEKCTTINASGVASWNTSYITMTLPAETASGKTSGVYNYIIEQNISKEVVAGKAYYWKKYDGNYYIRTASADGGWDLYKYRADNIMTLSEYSLTQTLSAPFSHYYCRFISEAERSTTDISYAIATDYSPNISGTLVGDATIGGDNIKVLPASANVRFSWNEETNGLRRAYLKNAQTENTRFLVLHGSDSKVLSATGTTISAKDDLEANELKFSDMGNWIYQVNLQAQPGAQVSLIANYNSEDRYLIGGASSYMKIIDGTGSDKYEMIAVYDFKTNRLMIAWTPSGTVGQNLTDVDVLLVRYQQEAGTVISLGTNKTVTSKTIIGAIRFDYNDMVGHVAQWNNYSRPKLKYFISFPFDVNVSDLFGLNSAYGDAYEIQMYDGAERAQKGFFRGDGTTTFWKTLQPGDVMKANEGYCVILDNDYFNNDIGDIWANKTAGSSVYLYFPSTKAVGSIESKTKTIAIPERECTIDRTFTTHQGSTREVNHKNTDSHWNIMGVPIFDTHSDAGTDGQPGAVFATSGTDGDGNFNYFYEWSPTTNQFAIHTARNYSFKSMHGYMVQYHGNVTFKSAATPSAIAARRAPKTENYQIELQVLNSNQEELNRTYVELREGADDGFVLNEDVYMSYNNLAVDIYTLAGNYDVAANVLSVGNHEIPVCVEVRKAGTYTFSMPSNFSGTATLVDSFTGERTNLALDDYEVNLQKGVIEDRFLLEIDVQKVATAIDGTTGSGSLKDGKAHKVLIDDVLYIVKDGVVYDARGARVK